MTFDAFVELIILHEIGHTRTTLDRGDEAAETAADAFAVHVLAKQPKKLRMGIDLFLVLDRYTRSLSALAIGQPGGRRGSLPDVSPQKTAEFDSVYTQLSCPELHPPFSARLVHMMADPGFRPVYEANPAFFDEYSERARSQVARCSATKQPAPFAVHDYIPHDITGVVLKVAQPELRVLDPGIGSRAPVRYAFPAADGIVLLDRKTQFHRSTSVDGGAPRKDKAESRSRFEVYFHTTEDQSEGPICPGYPLTVMLLVYDSTVGRLRTDQVYAWCVDTGGRVNAMALANRGNNRPAYDEADAAVQFKQDDIQPTIIAFPDDAIGVGARWTMISKFADGVRTTTSRLVKRDGTRLEVEAHVTFERRPGPDSVVRVETHDIQAHVDLEQPMPSSSEHAEIRDSVVNDNHQRQITTVLDVDQKVSLPAPLPEGVEHRNLHQH
jgi:hypothetical protein